MLKVLSKDAVDELRDYASFEFYRAGFSKIEVIVEPLRHHMALISLTPVMSVLHRAEHTLLTSEEDALAELKDIVRMTIARMKRTPAYRYEKIIIAPHGYDHSTIRYGHKVFRTSHISNKPRWWNW